MPQVDRKGLPGVGGKHDEERAVRGLHESHRAGQAGTGGWQLPVADLVAEEMSVLQGDLLVAKPGIEENAPVRSRLPVEARHPAVGMQDDEVPVPGHEIHAGKLVTDVVA